MPVMQHIGHKLVFRLIKKKQVLLNWVVLKINKIFIILKCKGPIIAIGQSRDIQSSL